MENFKVLETYKFQSKDYQITAGTAWNYALRLSNDSQPEHDLKVTSSGLEIGVPPFSLRGTPIAISAEVNTTCRPSMGVESNSLCRGDRWTPGRNLSMQQLLLHSLLFPPLLLSTH